MKFIHVSDTHLGCEIPVEYREIRKRDFLNAFKQVIDFAIKNKVDFIIHSGDFFDDYFRISSGILEEIIELLIKLRDNKIPLILIKGNHDLKGHRQRILNILIKLGLVKEAKINKPIEIKDIKIYGISEPSNLGGEELRRYYYRILSSLKYEKDGYNIFLFHGSIDALEKEFQDPRIVPTSYMPKNIDYYGLGHFHNKKIYKSNNIVFVQPGSTERTEISKIEEKSEKGFFYIKDENIEFVKIKTRRIGIIDKVINKETDLEELLKDIIKYGKDSLIKVRVRYKREMYDYLRNKIDYLIKSGYLIIEDFYPEDEEIEIEEIEEKDILESIINKSLAGNKKEIIDLFNKIKEIAEDLYTGRQSSIDKIRSAIRNLIKNEAL